MATIGIEWVKKYNGLASNLTNTKPQAEGFYNTFAPPGSSTGATTWPGTRTLRTRGLGSPPAGTEPPGPTTSTWCSSRATGIRSGFFFGKKIDDAKAKSTEIRWGDSELEYIVLDACNVLEEQRRLGRWGWPVFKGLHYILGFHTTTSDEAGPRPHPGPVPERREPVRQAWIKACQDTEELRHPVGLSTRRCAGHHTYHDHWWGKGSCQRRPRQPERALLRARRRADGRQT